MPDATPLGLPATLKSLHWLVVCDEILCALDENLNVYQYNFADQEWSPLGGPQGLCCSDGVSIWTVSAQNNEVWQLVSPGQWTEIYSSPAVQNLVASNNILYFFDGDGIKALEGTTVTPWGSGPPFDAFVLVGNNSGAYHCTSSAMTQIVIGGGTPQVFTPPANVSFVLPGQGVGGGVYAAGSEIVVAGSDNNIYTFECSSGQLINTIAAYSSAISYAYSYAPPTLVALTDENLVYCYDNGAADWLPFNIGGPPMELLFSGGAVPYGLASGGIPYSIFPSNTLIPPE